MKQLIAAIATAAVAKPVLLSGTTMPEALIGSAKVPKVDQSGRPVVVLAYAVKVLVQNCLPAWQFAIT